MNALLLHMKFPFLKKIQILVFKNQGLMQKHQFKSQPDEDYLPVKWQNYERKGLQSTMTTSLSQRILELNLFLLLLELGRYGRSMEEPYIMSL
jgi:hypothetical protein